MDKYFSKGLFYDEIKRCAGTFILVSVILIMKMIEIFLDKNEFRLGEFSDVIGFAAFFMACGIIANLYDSYNNKECKYGFMLTQPYKRDTIVITKFLTTMLSAILPLLIYGVIVSFIYISNSGGDLLKVLWEDILFSISMCIFLAAIIQFFNKLIGNAMVAIFMPIFLGVMAPITLGVIFIGTPLGLYRESLAEKIDPIINNISKVFHSNIILMPIILIVISLVIVCLSILINRKISYEKTSDLFLFKFVESLFAYLGSLFIATSMVIIGIVLVTKIFKFTINNDMYNFFVLSILDIVIITLTIAIKKLLYKFKRRMA